MTHPAEREARAAERAARTEPTTQIAIRVPDAMLERLDAWASAHAQPGLPLTRSDAVRMILAQALEAAK
jgi:hypothetical protein